MPILGGTGFQRFEKQWFQLAKKPRANSGARQSAVAGHGAGLRVGHLFGHSGLGRLQIVAQGGTRQTRSSERFFCGSNLAGAPFAFGSKNEMWPKSEFG